MRAMEQEQGRVGDDYILTQSQIEAFKKDGYIHLKVGFLLSMYLLLYISGMCINVYRERERDVCVRAYMCVRLCICLFMQTSLASIRCPLE